MDLEYNWSRWSHRCATRGEVGARRWPQCPAQGGGQANGGPAVERWLISLRTLDGRMSECTCIRFSKMEGVEELNGWCLLEAGICTWSVIRI